MAKSLDLGAASVDVAERREGRALFRSERTAYLTLAPSARAEETLKKAGVRPLPRDGRLYVIGEDALKIALVIGTPEDVRRPLASGLLKPGDEEPVQVVRTLLETLLGAPSHEEEPVGVTLPGPTLADGGPPVSYHQSVLVRHLEKMGYRVVLVPQGLAVILSEAPTSEKGEPLSGLGLSFGASGIHAALAWRGRLLAAFTCERGGDWLDQEVARATQFPAAKVTWRKEKKFSLAAPDPTDPVVQALDRSFDASLDEVLRHIAESAGAEGDSIPEPIEVVAGGRGASAPGFSARLLKAIRRTGLPFGVRGARVARDPGRAGANGALVAAIAEEGPIGHGGGTPTPDEVSSAGGRLEDRARTFAALGAEAGTAAAAPASPAGAEPGVREAEPHVEWSESPSEPGAVAAFEGVEDLPIAGFSSGDEQDVEVPVAASAAAASPLVPSRPPAVPAPRPGTANWRPDVEVVRARPGVPLRPLGSRTPGAVLPPVTTGAVPPTPPPPGPRRAPGHVPGRPDVDVTPLDAGRLLGRPGPAPARPTGGVPHPGGLPPGFVAKPISPMPPPARPPGMPAPGGVLPVRPTGPAAGARPPSGALPPRPAASPPPAPAPPATAAPSPETLEMMRALWDRVRQLEAREEARDEAAERAERKRRLTRGELKSGPGSDAYRAFFKKMVDERASDLFISSGCRAALRVDGRIKFVSSDSASPQFCRAMTGALLGIAYEEAFAGRKELDVALEIPGVGRFRANFFHQKGHPGAVFRHIQEGVPSFEELNLPSKQLVRLAAQQRGLALVTGVAGSGKSTTLAAMIQYINHNMQRHIVTIEDPIEFVHREKLSILDQREVGLDTRGFHEALKACVRQSPDVILIGEMRDRETMEAAISAAETGHLVFSTLHTVNSQQTVERIITYFPPHQHELIRLQLSMVLIGVLSQRLLPKKDGAGRVPGVEIMLSTPTIRELLFAGKTRELYKAISEDTYYGNQTFNQSLKSLYQGGVISLEEAMAAADNPEELKLEIRGISRGTKAADLDLKY